jgi:hypothetical protein
LKIKVRSDHSPRLQAGRLVYEALRKLGVPCDVQEGPGSVLYPLVMVDLNYHLYTSQWSGGRFPSRRLYNLYHSVNAFPGGSNYVTGGKFPFVGDNATDRARSGIDFPAYNMALDMGGFTRDWETTTWDDNGTIKTKLVMTFRSDGYFVKPVSGDLGKNVNASHFFMSAWHHYQADGWWSSYLKYASLHHINITSSHTFETCFDTYSYWNTYYAQIPLLPMDTWAQYDELVTLQTETFVNLTTPGIINLSADPIWIENVRFNGSPLAMFTDHNIVTGNLYVYSSLGAGTLEVEYWAVGSNPEGYYPGNLSW